MAILFYFLFQFFTYIIDFHFFSTALFYFIIIAIISYFLYYGDIRSKLVTTSLFVTLNYAAKLSAALIYLEVTNQNMPNDIFNLVLNPITQFIACIIVLLMLSLILATRKTSSKVFRSVTNFTICILPFINLYLSMHVLRQKNTATLYIDISFLLFFYTFALFFMIDQYNYNNEKTLNIELLNQQMNLQKQHFHELSTYNTELRAFRHDLKNHIRMMHGYLSSNQYTQAQNYLNQLDTNIQQITSVVFTGNNTVDIFLNQKLNIAKQLNIQFDYNILIPNHFDIPDLDLCIILSNLLDNAIDATSKVPNKKINLKMNIYKDQLLLILTNTFNGSIEKSSNQFISIKNDSKTHGFGINNVKRVVEQYQGTITFEYEQNEFMVTLLMPTKKAPIVL